MATLYLDCGMGAAGDMLAAALFELVPEKEKMLKTLNDLGLPGVEVTLHPAEKCGITGTRFSVTVHGQEEHSHDYDHEHNHAHSHDHDHTHDHDHIHDHDHGHHHHSSMEEIAHLVEHMNVSPKVRQDVRNVYELIAQAESSVHGVPVSEIHFHEVGTMDALADITAVCLLMEKLAPDRVVASPVHVGSGHVHCAHGILPVPAPATARILEGVPVYGGSIQGELCTPTGAALLKYFVNSFGPLPLMTVSATGYGMGNKDFPIANCLRAMLGTGEEKDTVTELSCNIDDMTGEELGFAMEGLLAEGALDVYTIPIGMKKCRPGVQLCVMCRTGETDRFTALLFRHTTTLGIREEKKYRRVLTRREEERAGIRWKIAEGYGVRREKPEYEDLAARAREQGVSLLEVKRTCGAE